MILALDYDGTYTEDPEFWDLVIGLAADRGHSVICATMRHQHEGGDVIAALGDMVEEIIFTGRKAKHRALEEAGYSSAIWIDDTPYWLFHDSY